MLTVRAYTPRDLRAMAEIWNAVVQEGNAFPQDQPLDETGAAAFFAAQSYTAVAETDGKILGLYILHPNNVGRCGHLCNASYAVRADARGQGTGEALVRDCLAQAAAHGFRILQFNAVVATNAAALALYHRLGFVQLGRIPGGFRLDSGEYVDIIPCYRTL